MRKLFEDLRNRLDTFIQQRDNLFMVVTCNDFETAYVLKTLQGLDEMNNSDIFWMFADEFNDQRSYVSTIVNHFQEKHGKVCEGLRKEGKEPWPSVSSSILDESQTSLQRLKELMIFARSLLPAPDGHLVIWAFFPYQIKDLQGYAQLVEGLIQHQFPLPWCHHMRIFLRDEKASPVLFERFQKVPRFSWYTPDFSVEAMEKSLKEEVMDKDVPLPQRLQSLLSVAGLDLSNRRYPEALKKFQILLPYYQGSGNHAMSALVLNWIGEVHDKTENPPEAQKYYESALTPAIESKSEPVLMNIVLNLANLKSKQEVWDEAEIYYESAEKIATALRVPQAKIMCLENKGVCRYKQKNVEGALESWNNGITLARAMEEKYLLKGILQRLRDHYDQAGRSKEKEDVEKELSSLDSSQD